MSNEHHHPEPGGEPTLASDSYRCLPGNQSLKRLSGPQCLHPENLAAVFKYQEDEM